MERCASSEMTRSKSVGEKSCCYLLLKSSDWPKLDDFVVHFLELAGGAAAFLAKLVKAAQQVGCDG